MSISFSGEEGHHGTPLSDAADAARYAPVGRYAMSIGLCDRRRAVSPSPERCSYTRCCCSASCDNQTKCTLKRGSQPQSERGGRSFRTPSGVGDGSNQASRTVSCPGRLRGNSLAMRSRLSSVSRGIGRHRAHMRIAGGCPVQRATTRGARLVRSVLRAPVRKGRHQGLRGVRVRRRALALAPREAINAHRAPRWRLHREVRHDPG